MDFHSLPQRIFLTQGLNLGLLHCRQILYHLSSRGSPKYSPGLTPLSFCYLKHYSFPASSPMDIEP